MSAFSTEPERKPLTHASFMKPDTGQKPDEQPGTLPGFQWPGLSSLWGGQGSSVNPLLAQGLFGHYTDGSQSGLQTPGPTVGPLASLAEPKPTLDDYRDHGDTDIDEQIRYNRELRGLIDKGGPIKPEITKAETDRLHEGREDLLGDLKERSGTYDGQIAALSEKLPEELPKNLTPEQQELVKQRTALETEKNKYSDQQTALQRWHDRNEINSINEKLKDPTLAEADKQKLLDSKKTLATGLLSTTQSYEQFDPRWGSTVYGKDKSYTNMTEAGCGPTSLAMMMDFADQEDPEGRHSRGEKDPYTPRKMADYATHHGRVKGSGTSGDTMMGDLSKSYPGFTGQSVGKLANAVESLNNGVPVMFLGHDVHGTRKDGTDTKYGGHYMMLNGVSDDGKKFDVLDGGRNKNKNIRSISDKQLKAGSAGYWNVKHNTH